MLLYALAIGLAHGLYASGGGRLILVRGWHGADKRRHPPRNCDQDL